MADPNNTVPDAELVARTCAGDRPAFDQLVTRHLARARAIARTIIPESSDADDAVQEAFLKAYDRLDQLVERETFAAWFAVIVRNEAHTILRKRSRRHQVALRESDASTSEGDIDDDGARAGRLRAALAKLPHDYREILALKYDAELDYQAIAETLSLSVANVEKRLYRARQALLKYLG